MVSERPADAHPQHTDAGALTVLRLFTAASLLIIALTVAACSGSSDETAPSADSQPAAQLAAAAPLEVSSPNFQENKRPRKRIPKENTCYADNLSPPLDWSGVPSGAKSLAVIVEEPQEARTEEAYYSIAPSFGSIHWVLYNIPPEVTGLPEGVSTSTAVLPDGTTQGTNEFGGMGYSGPCPPPSVVRLYIQPGRMAEPPHDYYFRVYALDAMIDLGPGATKEELTAAMEGHIVGFGEVTGKFQGPRQQGWFTSDSGSPVPNTPTPVP